MCVVLQEINITTTKKDLRHTVISYLETTIAKFPDVFGYMCLSLPLEGLIIFAFKHEQNAF